MSAEIGMNNIFSVDEDDCLDCLSSKAIFSVIRQRGLLQIGLEIAITLISQIDEVIAPADAPRNPFMLP